MNHWAMNEWVWEMMSGNHDPNCKKVSGWSIVMWSHYIACLLTILMWCPEFQEASRLVLHGQTAWLISSHNHVYTCLIISERTVHLLTALIQLQNCGRDSRSCNGPKCGLPKSRGVTYTSSFQTVFIIASSTYSLENEPSINGWDFPNRLANGF